LFKYFKKYLKAWMLLIVLAVLLTGCTGGSNIGKDSSSQADNNTIDSQVPSPSASGKLQSEQTEVPGGESSSTIAYDTPMHELEEDLNGDGKKDRIRLNITDEYSNEYRLQVNDVHIFGAGQNVEARFSIVDIDTGDNLKEIAVSEYGPSSDEKTAFYVYDGEKLSFIGEIEGFYSSLPELWQTVKFDGSGRLVTRTRGRILHTWFYKDYYKLDENHRLKHIPQDLYEMNAKVEVVREVSLQKSPEDPEEALTLKKGEMVTIVGSDNKEWCLVENSQGQKGWFALDGYNTVRGTGLSADEIFSGLCHAD